MTEPLTSGAIVEGELLPEPLRVVFVQAVGAQTKVGGQGLRTGQYFERVLTAEPLRGLRVTPAEAPFDGVPARVRLGIEAARLALAYELRPLLLAVDRAR